MRVNVRVRQRCLHPSLHEDKLRDSRMHALRAYTCLSASMFTKDLCMYRISVCMSMCALHIRMLTDQDQYTRMYDYVCVCVFTCHSACRQGL